MKLKEFLNKIKMGCYYITTHFSLYTEIYYKVALYLKYFTPDSNII